MSRFHLLVKNFTNIFINDNDDNDRSILLELFVTSLKPPMEGEGGIHKWECVSSRVYLKYCSELVIYSRENCFTTSKILRFIPFHQWLILRSASHFVNVPLRYLNSAKRDLLCYLVIFSVFSLLFTQLMLSLCSFQYKYSEFVLSYVSDILLTL